MGRPVLTMAGLVQLFNEWEIQLLVLLSFMLQAFLFFAGGLRRRTPKRFLRLLVWTAYLGADLVAAYALGLISRHQDAPPGKDTHQLFFLWAPFLLIHLGGQDTITGFAIEDNNLWLRHLLNLVVQVTLALYIFWKSANGPNTQLLVPSILLFITGTIKYGERTWALRSGVLKTLAESPLPHYALKMQNIIMASRPIDRDEVNQLLEDMHKDDSSSEAGVLSIALCSIESVISFFWHNGAYRPMLRVWFEERPHLLPKVLEILETELGLVYDYIYTKAVVFQTRRGVILRCISQASFAASFLHFLFVSKKGYNYMDTAITYALFAGAFCLEICAVFITVRSPWTWAWLKSQHYSFLASIIIRRQRKRVLWSNSMGQYNMHNFLGQYDDQRQSSSWKQGVRAVIRKVVDAVCGVEQKFWISKLLDIKFVEVDEIMRCIFQKVVEYSATVDHGSSLPQQWPHLGVLLQKFLPNSDGTLDWSTIAVLHTYTEAQLRRYSPSGTGSDVDGEQSTSVFVRKLSSYVVYLLATQPSMLPVSKDAEHKFIGISTYFAKAAAKIGNNSDRDEAFLRRAADMLTPYDVPVPDCCTAEQLLETKEAWIRLLIYIAGRSQPEIHARQLARGGELLTFVWLFMAHKGLGDSVLSRTQITDELDHDTGRTLVLFRGFRPLQQPEHTDSSRILANGAWI